MIKIKYKTAPDLYAFITGGNAGPMPLSIIA